jgi:TATA-box binding protein (TBP) (component of TFIID and TFIIIB)
MLKYGKIHFTCFASGKVIMTGIRNLKDVLGVLQSLEVFTYKSVFTN